MSRILFLVLVLVNLGWFGWVQFLAKPLQAPPASSAASIGPRLVLANEVASANNGTEQDTLPPPETDSVAAIDDVMIAAVEPEPTYQRGVSLGPFENLTEATKAMTSLIEVGYDPSQRIAEGQIRAGFQVSITGYSSQSEARNVHSELRSKGVTDAYVIPGTDPPHTISLGVFSNLARSRNRAREIRNMGFNPAVTERTRAGSVYWLDIVLDESGFINPADFDSDSSRILSLQIQACPVMAES